MSKTLNLDHLAVVLAAVLHAEIAVKNCNLMPLVYGELRRLAKYHIRRERAGHTLQTTALIHEAYLRLIDANQVKFENRAPILTSKDTILLADFENKTGDEVFDVTLPGRAWRFSCDSRRF